MRAISFPFAIVVLLGSSMAAEAAGTLVTFDNGVEVRLQEFRFVTSQDGHSAPPLAAVPNSRRLQRFPMDPDPEWTIPFGVNGYWMTLDLEDAAEIWLRPGNDHSIRIAEVTFQDGSRLSGQVYVGGAAWPPMPAISVNGAERVFNERSPRHYSLAAIIHLQRGPSGTCLVSVGGEPVRLRECRMSYDRPSRGTPDLEFPVTLENRHIRIPLDQIAKISFDDGGGQRTPVKVWLKSGQLLRGATAEVGAIRGYTSDGRFVLTKVAHNGYCIVREISFE
jgi:hypothetical protein